MDDAVGLLGAAAQRGQVLEVAAQDFGAQRAQGLRTVVRACQAEHVVAVLQQFGDEGAADEAGGAGEKDSHGKSSVGCRGRERLPRRMEAL